MSLTTQNLRDIVRQFSRNGTDTSQYIDAQIDRAIQSVCNRFVRITSCTRTTTMLALATSSAALPTLPADFRPQRFRRAWLSLDGIAKGVLTKFDYSSLLDEQISCSATAQRTPTMLAFDSWSTGAVYPTPDQDYDLHLTWVPPFTAWTPGSAPDPDSFNIPDDWLVEMLTYAGPAMLQHNETEHKYAAATWQKYLEFEKGFGNEGDLAGVASLAEMER